MAVGVMARADHSDCAGGCSGHAVGCRMPTYNNKKPRMKRMGKAKTRLCLMCREAFKSRWAGERVCQRCKGRDSWREGTTSSSDYVVHRRS